jgi:hypothetical protein
VTASQLEKCREYGKAGDLTGDDRESVEISALALHLVQAAIGYLNTQMIQIVLHDPAWQARLTDNDKRGLSALFWTHLNLWPLRPGHDPLHGPRHRRPGRMTRR